MSKTDELEARVEKLEDTMLKLLTRAPLKDSEPLPTKGLSDEHQRILDQIKEQEALLSKTTDKEERERIEARLKQLLELEAALRKALEQGGNEPE